MSNWVDIVGFQHEVAHVATLAHILGAEDDHVPRNTKTQLLQRLGGGELVKMGRIVPRREFPIQGRAIDLVIEVGTSRALVIEAKTDTDARLDQLYESTTRYKAQNPDRDATFVLMAFGAGGCTIPHKAEEIRLAGWRAMTLDDILAAVEGVGQVSCCRTVEDWLSALAAEQRRHRNLESNTLAAGFRTEAFLALGYRNGFCSYYLYYDKMRAVLERARALDGWEIYSGGRNPVFRWGGGRRDPDPGSLVNELYWEFCGERLFLKAHLKERGRIPPNLRSSVGETCARAGFEGRSARNSEGNWVSIWSWPFDFSKSTVGENCRKAEAIIGSIDPELPGSRYPGGG